MNLSRLPVRILTGAVLAAMAVAALRAGYRRRRAWRAQGRYHDVEISEAAILRAPRFAVYDLLRDPPRLAAALDAPGEVQRVDHLHYRWLPDPASPMPAALVEIVGDLPGVVLAWRSSNGPLPHEGSARLDVAGDSATNIQVRLRYRWSQEWARRGGVADDAPRTVLSAALRRLASTFSTPEG